MKKIVAVVEDEQSISELVALHLSNACFQAKEFPDGDSFYRFLSKETPDLIILDLMLPDADGLEICKFLKKERKFSSVPIIILTAKTEEADRILGLELGADDYVSKPFSPRELIARVKAVLRRKEPQLAPEQTSVAGILMLDPDKFEVRVQNKPVNLTTTEFRILHLLVSKKGRVFTRQQILDFLWGQEKAVIDKTIDVHIKNLREKLGKAGELIVNVRGIGYKIQE